MEWASFVVKNLVGRMLNPICAALLLSFIGTIIWVLRPDRRTGLILVVSGALLLLVMSLPMTGGLMVHSLELKAGMYADPAELSRAGVRWIVVLGGDLRGGDLSPADRVACTSLVRVMEGVRLWKELPKSKLVLSGGTISSRKMATGMGMALLAQEIGVPKDAIVVESQSWDTEDEARLLKPVSGERQIRAGHVCLPHEAIGFAFQAYGSRPDPRARRFPNERLPARFRGLDSLAGRSGHVSSGNSRSTSGPCGSR